MRPAPPLLSNLLRLLMRLLPLQLRRAGQDQVHRHHDRDSARLLPADPSQVRSQLLSHICRAVRLTRIPFAAPCFVTAAHASRCVRSPSRSASFAAAVAEPSLAQQVGVQSVYEDVARDTNRGHTVQATCESFQMAKDAGFKVVSHMMVSTSSSSAPSKATSPDSIHSLRAARPPERRRRAGHGAVPRVL